MMSFFKISTYRPFPNQPLKPAETALSLQFDKVLYLITKESSQIITSVYHFNYITLF